MSRPVLGTLFALLTVTSGIFGAAAATPIEPPVQSDTAASTPAYTRIGPIQHLPPHVAARSQPVRVHGVVTFGGPYFQDTGMFIEGPTGAVYVQTAHTPFEYGDSIRVEGTTAPGAYAPIVEEPRFTRLGSGSLPTPHTDTDRILAGQYDSHWVRLTGTVVVASQPGTEPRYYVLEIQNQRIGVHQYGGGHSETSAIQPGARIQIHGVAATLFNEQRQRVGVTVAVPDPRFLHVQAPASRTRPDPRPLPIGQIGTFRPDHWEPGPITISGSVTHVGPGSSFLTSRIVVQDSSGAAWVEIANSSEFEPGQRVRVTGRPQDGTYIPVLSRARVQLTGEREAVQPDTIGISELESGRYGGRLVRMSGTIVDTARTPQTYVLSLRTQNRTVTARLSRNQSSSNLRALPTGANVAVTGVLKPAPDWLHPLDLDNDIYPQRFALLMRRADDLTVVSGPPWWTRDRLIGGLTLTLLLGIGALGWVYTLRRRVRAQTQTIREERDRARDAARAKDAFLAQMSHEIRSPLSSVIGYADLLEQDEDLSDRHRKRVTVINDAGTRLRDTLDSILQLSALEAGSVELNPTTVDVADELRAQTQLFAPQAAEQGLDLTLDLPDADSLHTKVDRNALQRVLTNVINNAVKYTEDGSITVEASASSEMVEIRIEDTGPGMSNEEIQRILKPFEQASRGYSREYEGAGLGLPIVKRLVEEMEGALRIDSEPGGGTRVVIRLPRSPRI